MNQSQISGVLHRHKDLQRILGAVVCACGHRLIYWPGTSMDMTVAQSEEIERNRIMHQAEMIWTMQEVLK